VNQVCRENDRKILQETRRSTMFAANTWSRAACEGDGMEEDAHDSGTALIIRFTQQRQGFVTTAEYVTSDSSE
jgi:hypothetical protein